MDWTEYMHANQYCFLHLHNHPSHAQLTKVERRNLRNRFRDNCDTGDEQTEDEFRFHELCWQSQALEQAKRWRTGVERRKKERKSGHKVTTERGRKKKKVEWMTEWMNENQKKEKDSEQMSSKQACRNRSHQNIYQFYTWVKHAKSLPKMIQGVQARQHDKRFPSCPREVRVLASAKSYQEWADVEGRGTNWFTRIHKDHRTLVDMPSRYDCRFALMYM